MNKTRLLLQYFLSKEPSSISKNHYNERIIIDSINDKLCNWDAIITKFGEGNTIIVISKANYINETKQLFARNGTERIAKDLTEDT